MHNFLHYLQIVLTYVLELYLVVLIGTMIISWIRAFARDWVPHGIILVLCETSHADRSAPEIPTTPHSSPPAR